MKKWNEFDYKETIADEDTVLVYDSNDDVLKQVKGKDLIPSDTEMSDESENPVQNKVVKQYVDDMAAEVKIDTNKYTDTKVTSVISSISTLHSDGYNYTEHELGINRSGEGYIISDRSTEIKIEPNLYYELNDLSPTFGENNIEAVGDNVQILEEDKFGTALAIWNDDDAVGENYAKLPLDEIKSIISDNDCNLTIAMYVKVSDLSVTKNEMLMQIYVDDENWFGINGMGQLIYHTAGVDSLTISPDEYINRWEWVHIAVTANYSGLHYYINGYEVGSNDWNWWNTLSGYANNATEIRLGTGGYVSTDDDGNTTTWYTDIHSAMYKNIAIYGQVLSTEDIQSICGTYATLATKDYVSNYVDNNVVDSLIVDLDGQTERDNNKLYLAPNKLLVTDNIKAKAIEWSTYTDEDGYEHYNNYTTGDILYFPNDTTIYFGTNSYTSQNHTFTDETVNFTQFAAGTYILLGADITANFDSNASHTAKYSNYYLENAQWYTNFYSDVTEEVESFSIQNSDGEIITEFGAGMKKLTGLYDVRYIEDGAYQTDLSTILTDANGIEWECGNGILVIDRTYNYMSVFIGTYNIFFWYSEYYENPDDDPFVFYDDDGDYYWTYDQYLWEEIDSLYATLNKTVKYIETLEARIAELEGE